MGENVESENGKYHRATIELHEVTPAPPGAVRPGAQVNQTAWVSVTAPTSREAFDKASRALGSLMPDAPPVEVTMPKCVRITPQMLCDAHEAFTAPGSMRSVFTILKTALVSAGLKVFVDSSLETEQ